MESAQNSGAATASPGYRGPAHSDRTYPGATVIQPFLSLGRGGGPGKDHMGLHFPPEAQIGLLLTVARRGKGAAGHSDTEVYVLASRR